jgi:hypothetical protein
MQLYVSVTVTWMSGVRAATKRNDDLGSSSREEGTTTYSDEVNFTNSSEARETLVGCA